MISIRNGHARLALFGLATAIMAMPALAQEVAVDKVREIGAKTSAIAFDSATGAVYQRYGNSPDDRKVDFYQSAEAFEANKPSFGFDLLGPGLAGTYMAAQGYQLFGHALGEKVEGNSAVAAWIGKGGDLNGFRESLPDLGANKDAATFDWGGFTSLNWLQDNTGTYVLGSHDANTWLLFRMKGLEIETAQKFATTGLGFAFMLDGTLYTGASAKEAVVNQAFNFEKGTMADVKYVFSDLTGSDTLITGTAYDVKNDRLYLTDSAKGLIFGVKNARAVFASGGGIGAVPEPATWAMLLAGFGMVGFSMRRRQAAVRPA